MIITGSPLSIPREAVVASNVRDIGMARVVILLGKHAASPHYTAECENIQTIIKFLYKREDIILVEDPWNRQKAKLVASHIPDLPRGEYTIEGWDDPEVCRQAEEIGEFAQKVQEAIHNESIEKLTRIAGHIFGIPQNEEQKKLFLLNCEEYYLNSAESFALSRADLRHESAVKRTRYHLGDGKGKVIMTMGPEHAISAHPVLQAANMKLILGLQGIPHVIVNAALCQKSPMMVSA